MERPESEGTAAEVENTRLVDEPNRRLAEEARKATEELRSISEIALEANDDQAAIMQEIRETLLRYKGMLPRS